MTPGPRPAAIVTGSDSGIGRATALALADAGFDVGITWHTDEAGADETAQLIAERNGTAEVSHLNLCDTTTVGPTITGLAGRLGRLDAFVNNAGADHTADFEAETLAAWARVVAINLTGAFLCSQAAVACMRRGAGAGRIVNVTSVHEHSPVRGRSSYCAAKAGLGMLTKVMALELGGDGISVNAVAPGHVATPMTADQGALGSPQRDGIPVGRIAAANEIAEVIAFLCTPQASYVNGASLVVDGGLLLTAAETLTHSLNRGAMS